MKALVCKQFGPLDDLTIEDLPIPVPGPGKVTINIKAASLNFPDALTVQGLYQVKPPTPFVPGAEFAGVIHAVGEGVTHVKVGDRVISTGRGGFAEYAEADARILMPIPPSMSFEQAAAFVLTYATSYHALKDVGNLQPGETLLVLGAAGGVGTTAIQLYGDQEYREFHGYYDHYCYLPLYVFCTIICWPLICVTAALMGPRMPPH